jgi:DNA-binding LacI/PurR family transcriptional regulator
MWGEDFPAIHKINYDQADFLAQACAWFAQRRRKRVALISVPGQFSPTLIDGLTKRHGLESPAHWRQTIHPTHAPSARACAHLLLHSGQRRRPDALLVSDDNLVEQALAGLADAGVRLDRDLLVVAHANFPTPWTTVPGLRRLGYDAHATLAACVASIDAQRLGRTQARQTAVRALFEDAASG